MARSSRLPVQTMPVASERGHTSSQPSAHLSDACLDPLQLYEMMIMKKKDEKAERKKRKQLAKEKEAQEVRNGVQVLEVQLLWKSHGERPGTVSRYWRYSYFGKPMARGRERCPGIGGTVTLEKQWCEARNSVQVLEVQLLWRSNGERPGKLPVCGRYTSSQ